MIRCSPTCHAALSCASLCFRIRRFGSNSSNQGQQESNQFALLPSRGIISLKGQGAAAFLQGLTTNHIPKIERGGDGFYTAFLTAQGRLLFDAFVYPKNVGRDFPHPEFLIETAKPLAEKLRLHLRRYLLRAKLELSDVSDQYRAWSVWGPSTSTLWTREAIKDVPPGSLVMRDGQPLADVGCTDPRWTGMGLRILLPNGSKPSLPPGYVQKDEEEYTIRRIVNGIPEGTDFFHGQSLPLESNLDYMNAIDFRKGCYVGQELTIRTYHTGVTRKRIVPVLLKHKDDATHPSADSPPLSLSVDRKATWTMPGHQSEILAPTTGKTIGKFCAGIHNLGLALMRLEHVDVGRECPISGSDLTARPFIPGAKLHFNSHQDWYFLADSELIDFTQDWWPVSKDLKRMENWKHSDTPKT